MQSENVNPFQNSAVVCWPEKNYVLTTFEGGSLLHFASYCHSDTFFVCFGNVIKYGKVAQFTAFYSNLGGNMKPIRVLFVCHGNICRSPMAEFMFKRKLEECGLSDKFYVESAATSDEECWNGIGNPVYPPAKAELAKHGISCEGKRARQIRKDDYDRFDYLIGMEDANIRNMQRVWRDDPEGKICKLLDFTNRKGNISDPWYSGDFATTYSDIEEGLRGFLDIVAQSDKN